MICNVVDKYTLLIVATNVTSATTVTIDTSATNVTHYRPKFSLSHENALNPVIA